MRLLLTATEPEVGRVRTRPRRGPLSWRKCRASRRPRATKLERTDTGIFRFYEGYAPEDRTGRSQIMTTGYTDVPVLVQTGRSKQRIGTRR